MAKKKKADPSEEEVDRRMKAAANSWDGCWCSFLLNGARVQGKIVWAEYDGFAGGLSQFTVQVQGESGRIVKVDYRRGEVKIF